MQHTTLYVCFTIQAISIYTGTYLPIIELGRIFSRSLRYALACPLGRSREKRLSKLNGHAEHLPLEFAWKVAGFICIHTCADLPVCVRRIYAFR